MRYKVPRYIEYKAKIVGPATFGQLGYLGAAAFVIFTLYIFMGYSSLFMLISVVVGSISAALAFLQIKGEPLPEYIKKMILFSFSSKKYVWRKEDSSLKTKIPSRTKVKKIEKEEENKVRLKNEGRIGKIIDRLKTS